MTDQQKESQYGPVVARLSSKSDPDKIYEVRYRDGRHSCQCNAWRFRKTCRHVNYCAELKLTVPPLETDDLEKAIEAAFESGACRSLADLRCPARKLAATLATVLRPMMTLAKVGRGTTAAKPESVKIRAIILDD